MSTKPEEITVTFSLKLTVADDEAKDYWVANGGGQENTASIYAIADLFDSYDGVDGVEILSINGVTKAEVQKLLNTEAGL